MSTYVYRAYYYLHFPFYVIRVFTFSSVYYEWNRNYLSFKHRVCNNFDVHISGGGWLFVLNWNHFEGVHFWCTVCGQKTILIEFDSTIASKESECFENGYSNEREFMILSFEYLNITPDKYRSRLCLDASNINRKHTISNCPKLKRLDMPFYFYF